MQVEIWSDVVCPWCYIGKRRFEAALDRVSARRDTSTIEIVYRPYQLDRTAPSGRSQPGVEAYAKKFGGVERAAQIMDNVTSIAAGDGLEFHMDRALRANTLLAHRLLWFAEQHGDQILLKERLLRAYFVEGLDIGDAGVLARCAGEIGMDIDAARSFLDSDDGSGEIMEQLAVAAANGITAVPTYVFNGQWSVPGAQDAELFERILDKMLDAEQQPANV